MPRCKKMRLIAQPPPVSVFKPAGIPARELRTALLRLDEYEAVRLADRDGLMQEEVARLLGVSRPTVSRILDQAHRTIATALVEGMALVIEGGPVTFASAEARCPGPGCRGAGPCGRGRRHRGMQAPGGRQDSLDGREA